MSNPAFMFSYWRDKKGLVVAMKEYYSDLLEQHSDLKIAVYQILANEALIEKRMQELAYEEEDENE